MEIDVIKLLKLNASIENILSGFDDLYESKKVNLTLKDKFLIFLSEGPLTPYKLINLLGVAKTNLVLLSNSLLDEKLIVKNKDEIDKRNIVYSITQEGEKRVEEIIFKINVYLNNQQKFKSNAEGINENIDKILSFFSK